MKVKGLIILLSAFFMCQTACDTGNYISVDNKYLLNQVIENVQDTYHKSFTITDESKQDSPFTYEEKVNERTPMSTDDCFINEITYKQEEETVRENPYDTFIADTFAIFEIKRERIIDPDKPMIALTFDDGPSDCSTGKILDILEEYRVRATFFVVGENVRLFPKYVIRAFESGHEIGNHSYSHPYLTQMSELSLSNEIEKTNRIIGSYVNCCPLLVRPTYGEVNDKVVHTLNYPLILWSVDPYDWKYRDKDRITEEVLKNVKDGSIVILHDLYQSTADAVEILTPKLLDKGYQLVTVSELYKFKGKKLESKHIYNGWW